MHLPIKLKKHFLRRHPKTHEIMWIGTYNTSEPEDPYDFVCHLSYDWINKELRGDNERFYEEGLNAYKIKR